MSVEMEIRLQCSLSVSQSVSQQSVSSRSPLWPPLVAPPKSSWVSHQSDDTVGVGTHIMSFICINLLRERRKRH